ncbi:PrpF protein-domain-containing protein [Cercophora newfieldiana]|uniref:PrpF protein-domain-containing protein n=1 Tax=Cercophora newfieldiana TaxID=92897 RepID=A0AA39Y4H7_9PEZI|nr:PrpF protein-domain-containing protein [Cercophora newfieldiana]
MATVEEIQCFKRAMEAAYGLFDTLTEAEAEMWEPPDNPGAGGHRGRYLWTDAFGVVNFITLAKETVSPVYLVLAKRLVNAVHNVLGWEGDGSARLYPATEEEPLKGGLRMGKTEAEAEGDAQFHYSLILWIFVLNRLALATGEIKYNRLAVQLAKAVFAAFIKWDGTGLRLAWKVSADRRVILVPEEGHFDAAAGYAVLQLVQEAAEQLDGAWGILSREIASYHLILGRVGRPTICQGPLDYGMGLWLLQFFRDEDWALELMNECLILATRALIWFPKTDIARRAAFRELSTCLGLKCHGVGMGNTVEMQAVMMFWPSHYEIWVPDQLKPLTLVTYAAALTAISGYGSLDLTQEATSFPAIFARGGTSNGLVIQRRHLPPEDAWSTVGVKDGSLDMAGNCGNMSSAIGPISLDEGLLTRVPETELDPTGSYHTALVRIFNTNTSKIIHSRFKVSGSPPRYCHTGDYEMDGVPGTQSKIVLSFVDPAGAKTGRALPTGLPVDTLPLPDGSKIEASLVDVSNPGVFVRVSDLGLTDTTSLDPASVEADPPFKERLEQIRQAGAAKMGLDPTIQSVPKIVLIFPPPMRSSAPKFDIRCLALSMGQAHKVVPLTLGLCLGAAVRLPGTIPNQLVQGKGNDGVVTIGHPSGRLEVGTTLSGDRIISAELHRTARVLMKGDVFY